LFYFSHTGNLTSSRVEFHKSRRSPNADSSFVYLLHELEHIGVNHILDYLEHETVINQEGSLGLQDEIKLVEHQKKKLDSPYDHLNFGQGLTNLVEKKL
jgi:hypothetical protein